MTKLSRVKLRVMLCFLVIIELYGRSYFFAVKILVNGPSGVMTASYSKYSSFGAGNCISEYSLNIGAAGFFICNQPVA